MESHIKKSFADVKQLLYGYQLWDLALLPTPEERGVNVGATEIPIIS